MPLPSPFIHLRTEVNQQSGRQQTRLSVALYGTDGETGDALVESLRLLILCHDNNGISKTMRAMKIATHLARSLADCSILVLTDLSIIGKFRFPENVDFVHLPGLIYQTNNDIRARNLNIASASALKLRRKIVQSTAKTFKPHLILVESDLNKVSVSEIYRTLRFLRDNLEQTKIVWGLPDTVGLAHEVERIWSRYKIAVAFEKVVDEIWVYGCRNLFDFAMGYKMPPAMAQKLKYLGYLRSPLITAHKVKKEVQRKDIRQPLVLVSAGSGQDGYQIIKTYFEFLEEEGESLPFQSLILTGPMMSTAHKRRFVIQATRFPGVIVKRFCKQVLEYMQYADLVLSTGGYNSICDILSYRKKAIIIPVGGSFDEHKARAELLASNGFMRVLPPEELTSLRLREMVRTMFASPPKVLLRKKRSEFPLDGLEAITDRLKALANLEMDDFHKAAS